MLRIVIFEQNQEIGHELFQTAQIAVRQSNTKCELSHTANPDKLIGNLVRDKKYYDVMILNAQDAVALGIARDLRKVNMNAAIIFANADHGELNDLLKYRPSALIDPNDAAQITDSLTFCIAEQLRCRRYFTIRNKEALFRVDFEDIYYIESRQRIAVMYVGSKVFEFYAKLGDIFKSLPQDLFVRCHQSYIVNMNHVRTLDKSARCFHMNSGEVIEISKANYTQVLAQFTTYLER